jgi:hypothetical protein
MKHKIYINKLEQIDDLNNNIYKIFITLKVTETTFVVQLFNNYVLKQTETINISDLPYEHPKTLGVMVDKDDNISLDNKDYDLTSSASLFFGTKHPLNKGSYSRNSNEISASATIKFFKFNKLDDSCYISVCLPCYFMGDSKFYELNAIREINRTYFVDRLLSDLGKDHVHLEDFRSYTGTEIYAIISKRLKNMQNQIDINSKLLTAIINASEDNVSLAKLALSQYINYSNMVNANNILNEDAIDISQLIYDIGDSRNLLTDMPINIDTFIQYAQ